MDEMVEFLTLFWKCLIRNSCQTLGARIDIFVVFFSPQCQVRIIYTIFNDDSFLSHSLVCKIQYLFY